MPAYERVASFVQSHGLLPDGARVVVGVSGGPDSLCLFDCLQQLGYAVIVAHLDHRLRPTSWREAEFVLGLAASRGVPAVAERLPKDSLPIAGMSLEEGARLLRYEFLERVAEEHRATFVAVGHTSDDQAETILMHFLRGSGVDGLRGMLPSSHLPTKPGSLAGRNVTLVRPLLELNRAETEAHCREIGLKPRVDLSNSDLTYYRNRLRHELLPFLATYNPSVRDGLIRLGNVMQAQAELLRIMVNDRIPSVLFEHSPGVWALNRDGLVREPRALQMELVREAARRAAPDARDFDHKAVVRALEWVAMPRVGKRLSLPGALEMVDEGALLILRPQGVSREFREFPQLSSTEPVAGALPFELELGAGWRLKGRRGKGARGRRSRSTLVARFDATRLHGPAVIRAPKPGDRIVLDREGTLGKVADLFINRHIPRAARVLWPLLVVSGEILWVVGLRPSAASGVGPSTREVLEFVLDPPKEEAQG